MSAPSGETRFESINTSSDATANVPIIASIMPPRRPVEAEWTDHAAGQAIQQQQFSYGSIHNLDKSIHRFAMIAALQIHHRQKMTTECFRGRR